MFPNLSLIFKGRFEVLKYFLNTGYFPLFQNCNLGDLSNLKKAIARFVFADRWYRMNTQKASGVVCHIQRREF